MRPGEGLQEADLNTPRKAGRPSAADKELAAIEAVFDRHSNGEPLAEICADLGLKQAEFRAAIRKGPAELQEQWRRAKEEFSHSIFDQMASLTRTLATTKYTKEDGAKVQALRAAMDGLKHIAARINPQNYGEQKVGPQQPTIIINTSLPIGIGDSPANAIDGDFKVLIPKHE